MPQDKQAPADYWPDLPENLRPWATVPFRARHESRLTRERFIIVLKALGNGPKAARELDGLLPISGTVLRNHLVRWTRQGRLERVPVTPDRTLGRPAFVYRLPAR